ncbi:MAG: GNAT family N-acetyltransferase [Clostridia bacterium]|nr:GNAT family N-acetyltransferase [Clostridia bacterium]
MDIQILPLTRDNFRADSLDGFIRHQQVTECWRNVGGEWKLLPNAYTEDWDLPRLRGEAAALLHTIDAGIPVIGAFEGQKVVGFSRLGGRLGSRGQYMELTGYQVSAPYRGQGIGRRLFESACEAARSTGADKLYISAHSSRESQAAYRALGCVHAQEVDPVRAEQEPFDVQMEYDLRPVPVIRFGVPGDLPSWMALVRRVAWNFPGLETEAALQEHAATVAKFIDKDNAICAVEGDCVIGVLLFSRRLNMLCCMAVAPEHRRRRIAQRMLGLMMTIADPARDLIVTTFREGDPKGDAPRAFYRKNGFVPAELVVENDYPCQTFVRKEAIHE